MLILFINLFYLYLFFLLLNLVHKTSLEALDDFSDTLHNDILVQARAAGLTVELLDAKGDILLD